MGMVREFWKHPEVLDVLFLVILLVLACSLRFEGEFFFELYHHDEEIKKINKKN
jgi:hypothetical protein